MREVAIRARQVGRQLQLATEMLNEKLRDLEDLLHDRRAPPARVGMTGNRWLVWDGDFLLVECGGERRPLLECSRESRVEAVDLVAAFAFAA